MSQRVFILLFLISKLSLYEKLSTNHEIDVDLNNHRSYFTFGVIYFSEIKEAINYQIIVTFFFPPKILSLSHGQNSS